MGKKDKLLLKILSGASDANIQFDELCRLLVNLGFDLRIRGSHHMFRKKEIIEKINLQRDGSMARPYQVKQVRNIILKYRFGGPADV
jgi:hypothetical protein